MVTRSISAESNREEGFTTVEVPRAQRGTLSGSQFAPNAKRSMSRTLIPRAVEAIFERLHDKKYSSFSVVASYLEIYNEELTDLLVEEAPLVTPRSGFGGSAAATRRSRALCCCCC